MTRVNITIDRQTLTNIDTISRLTGATRSEIIRRGVAAYIQELKEQFGVDVSKPVAKKKTK